MAEAPAGPAREGAPPAGLVPDDRDRSFAALRERYAGVAVAGALILIYWAGRLLWAWWHG